MKKLIFNSVLLISITIFVVSCDPSKKFLKSVEKNKIEKTFTVKTDETITIDLKANPSTGYQWVETGKANPKIVKFENKKYVADDESKAIVGKGGTETWTFKAKKAGKAYIHLQYIRSTDENGKFKEEKFYEFIVK